MVRQLFIYTSPPFSGFPFHLGHHGALSRVPCALPQVLIRHLFYALMLLHSRVGFSTIPQLKPTKLLCPWDSPGRNTGVGCHFLVWSGSSQPRGQTNRTRVSCISCIGRWVLYHWAAWKSLFILDIVSMVYIHQSQFPNLSPSCIHKSIFYIYLYLCFANRFICAIF